MMRTLSLLLTVVALVGVPLWAYLQGETIVHTQVAAHGWACGMPVLGLYLFAMFVAGGVSLVALVLAALSYRKLPKPRSGWRTGELLVVASPLLLAAALIGLLWAGDF